jgi:hypothetical protein
MMFVVAKANGRAGEEGKDTVFLHGGSQITSEKIEKFKRRKISNDREARHASMSEL